MKHQKIISAAAVSALLLLGIPFADAQNQQVPDVSYVNLQVVHNADGSQSVITPKGDLAVLPGPGVAGDVAQIYFGSQGGFWYTDRTGKTVDLSKTVEALQARRARAAQASQIPQYAPVPQQDYYQEGGQDDGEGDDDDGGRRGGRVGNAVNTAVTATAAGVGAAAGAALSNNYYRAPYGTPMYYGAHGPYYYDHGERRELDDINLNQNQKVAIHNKRTIEKQNQQKAASHLASQRGSSASNFEAQQNYYHQQRQANPERFQHSGDNPFTRGEGRSARSGGGGRREGRSVGRGGGGGRSRGGGGRRR
jgi:hypothetical protein